MTVSGHTLIRIQSLARLYQTGYRSNTVDAIIEKLVAMERARLRAEADGLAVDLRAFEHRNLLSSEEFNRRFQAGALGDDADMFEWSALYQMWMYVQERLETLQP